MKNIKLLFTRIAFLFSFALCFGLPNSMSADPLPANLAIENNKRIPNGTYCIPSNKQTETETTIQIIDGEVCFIAISSKKNSETYQVDSFRHNGLEVITIWKGDDRKVFASKAGHRISPEQISPKQVEELRAIDLSTKLMVNILTENPDRYRKDIEQAAPRNR